jgi:hypothetical protein
MKLSALRVLFCAVFALLLALEAEAQTQLGRIRAARVENEVYKVAADGSRLRIKDGAELKQSDTVVTGSGASVVLVFENGASVRVGADSSLAIEEFAIDPLEQEVKVSELKAEPTKSRTTLNLSYGEMVGDVKKLNTSSSYSIKTPVGAAGIRGTTFRIVFRPTTDGKAFTFQLSTAEGLVIFQGTAQGGSGAVDVPSDKEVVVTGEIDTATGTFTVSEPLATTPLSADTRNAILDIATQVIQQAVQQAVFPTQEPQPTPSPDPQQKNPELTPKDGA